MFPWASACFFDVLCVEFPYPVAAVFSEYVYLPWEYQPPQAQEGRLDEEYDSKEARREVPLLSVTSNSTCNYVIW